MRIILESIIILLRSKLIVRYFLITENPKGHCPLGFFLCLKCPNSCYNPPIPLHNTIFHAPVT